MGAWGAIVLEAQPPCHISYYSTLQAVEHLSGMVTIAYPLAVIDLCAQETLPTYGNNQLKELVFGHYWKKNSATHKQHLEELRGSGRTALSPALTNRSEWANQQTSGIIINNLRPNTSKSSSGNVLSAAHTNRSESKLPPLENSNNNPDIWFPITIETIISHLHLTPKIHMRTCCPQCFSLYRTDNTPSQFSFRATPKSQLCESSLSPGKFVFQSLVEWLGMFLNCPGIEEHLEILVKHISVSGAMEDIWDSQAWKEYKDSEGRIIRSRLGPGVCNLPAIRKIRHSSARHLCQFCNVKKTTLDVVDNAKTNSKRKRIVTRHGVRYFVLLKLPYFDLTDNSVVEPMHNIFLGLLRHHSTKFFGLKKKENNHRSDPDDLNRLVQQDDISDLRKKLSFRGLPVQSNKHLAVFYFTLDNLQSLCTVIQEIRLPSHIGRIPGTVGQPKGGKLKAEKLINLFSILLITTFLLSMKKSSSQLSISNLVHQNRITNEDINNLEEHLKLYCQGILRLYPQCISCLGPAPCWTAWTFERLNGSLAAIPTNKKIGGSDFFYTK
ncbi:hypothetical protein VP01_76g15 [Puccinia sorghi]|uniref:Uncharacterized protein n=1 Tax=Puccinia sorghi TaxID=27349 RepID=A0A0L6UCF5_9BASI|nr:hypothetical protein VP01_76g15 [Puccinia sorghi]